MGARPPALLTYYNLRYDLLRQMFFAVGHSLVCNLCMSMISCLADILSPIFTPTIDVLRCNLLRVQDLLPCGQIISDFHSYNRCSLV
jgi:hypothetical protein